MVCLRLFNMVPCELLQRFRGFYNKEQLNIYGHEWIKEYIDNYLIKFITVTSLGLCNAAGGGIVSPS